MAPCLGLLQHLVEVVDEQSALAGRLPFQAFAVAVVDIDTRPATSSATCQAAVSIPGVVSGGGGLVHLQAIAGRVVLVTGPAARAEVQRQLVGGVEGRGGPLSRVDQRMLAAGS